MKRREFLLAAGAGALASHSLLASSQNIPRFADMHAHLMAREGISRDALARDGMLLVTEKVVPDYFLIRRTENWMGVLQEPKPGAMRRSFEAQFQKLRGAIDLQRLPRIDSREALDRVLHGRVPAVVLASEGADFLEGDLSYLQQARAAGLVYLQLVHYRISDIGDISTEKPRHGGLTSFGKDVVSACNRLGILVDVAHCSSAGIEQAIDLSGKPLVYSHGHVLDTNPGDANLGTWQGGVARRAIHRPLAKALVAKGGVVGIWPLGLMYPTRQAYASALLGAVEALGEMHVGIGSDMNGLPSTVLPSHGDFADLAEILSKQGLKDAAVEGIMGGNFVRVLRAALMDS